MEITYLISSCVQIAVHFAELHDTPVRMKEKGGVRAVVAWKESRRFLYWRFTRFKAHKCTHTTLKTHTHNTYVSSNKHTQRLKTFTHNTYTTHTNLWWQAVRTYLYVIRIGPI